MLTFHNDPAIKKKYIERLELHSAHDEIVKGIYWENGRGCGVGCTIHSNDHAAYEKELGIPRLIARLEDRIFEGLPNDIAKDFPLRFLNAVPVGVDLNMIFYQFMHWLLIDKEDGIIKFSQNEKSRIAIQNVANLFEKRLAGENIEYLTWRVPAYAYAADAADAAAAREKARIKQADKLIELISAAK